MNKRSSLQIIGTKPGQYQGRAVELVTADGTRIAQEFPNASSQGAAIKRLAAAGTEVVALDFTNDHVAELYRAAAAKRAQA